MLALVLIYSSIAGLAALRGYKSPLFGAAGIILYIILQFPAAALLPESSDWTQNIVAALAAVACLSGLVLLLPRKNARAEPKQSAVPYAALGVVCLLLCVAVVGLWLLLITSGVNPSVTILGAALLLTAALVCFRLNKQQTLPSAAEALRHDPRAPVLFLRSFRADQARVKPKLGQVLPMYPEWMGKSFEEFLAPAVKRFGPFIALGNPEDYLPTPGAYKVYQKDANWEETVLSYLRRAELVLLVEGDTPGLRWELGQVRQRCAPRTVFLITPARPFPRAGWRPFVGLLGEAGFEATGQDPGPGAVVGFDKDYRPVVLLQGARHAADYAEAIARWHEPGAGRGGDSEVAEAGMEATEKRQGPAPAGEAVPEGDPAVAVRTCPKCGQVALSAMARRCRFCHTDFPDA